MIDFDRCVTSWFLAIGIHRACCKLRFTKYLINFAAIVHLIKFLIKLDKHMLSSVSYYLFSQSKTPYAGYTDVVTTLQIW